MRLRNPLIALTLLAGLSVYVYLVEIRGEKRRQEEKDTSEKVFPFPPEEITEVVFSDQVDTVRLKKEGEDWKILEPVETRPEEASLNRLLQSVGSLRINRDLGVIGDLAPYNLEKPPVGVRLRTASAGAEVGIWLGDDAPTSGDTYARRDAAEEVLVVSGAAALRSVSLFSLREKEFLGFDPAQISRCRIEREGEEVSLARVEGEWRLTSPLLAVADRGSVSDLLFSLERLRVSEFLAEEPTTEALSRSGLHPPRLKVFLSGEQWEGEKEVLFGDETEEGLLARRPGTGELVRVPKGVQTKLRNPVDSFRKKEIMPFSRFELVRLRVTGVLPEPLTLERREEVWSQTTPLEQAVDDDAVDLLLRQLSSLRAERFLDTDPALGRLGLDPPEVTLEFWREEEAEGTAEVVEVGVEQGGERAMRNPAWPSVMLVKSDSWAKLPEQIRTVAQGGAESTDGEKDGRD